MADKIEDASGEHISDAAARAVATARESGAATVFEFDHIRITVEPHDTVGDVCAKFVVAHEAVSRAVVSERLLVVLYDMVDGRLDVPVPVEKVRQRANALGVKMMTDTEFKVYHDKVVDRVTALKEEAAKKPS